MRRTKTDVPAIAQNCLANCLALELTLANPDTYVTQEFSDAFSRRFNLNPPAGPEQVKAIVESIPSPVEQVIILGYAWREYIAQSLNKNDTYKNDNAMEGSYSFFRAAQDFSQVLFLDNQLGLHPFNNMIEPNRDFLSEIQQDYAKWDSTEGAEYVQIDDKWNAFCQSSPSQQSVFYPAGSYNIVLQQHWKNDGFNNYMRQLSTPNVQLSLNDVAPVLTNLGVKATLQLNEFESEHGSSDPEETIVLSRLQENQLGIVDVQGYDHFQVESSNEFFEQAYTDFKERQKKVGIITASKGDHDVMKNEDHLPDDQIKEKIVLLASSEGLSHEEIETYIFGSENFVDPESLEYFLMEGESWNLEDALQHEVQEKYIPLLPEFDGLVTEPEGFPNVDIPDVTIDNIDISPISAEPVLVSTEEAKKVVNKPVWSDRNVLFNLPKAKELSVSVEDLKTIDGMDADGHYALAVEHQDKTAAELVELISDIDSNPEYSQFLINLMDVRFKLEEKYGQKHGFEQEFLEEAQHLDAALLAQKGEIEYAKEHDDFDRKFPGFDC